MIEFALATLISLIVVITVTVLHYEFMRVMSDRLEHIHTRHRYFIVFVVVALFVLHTISIWIYGAVYWLMEMQLSFGKLQGINDHQLLSFAYFSASTYSSLGFGDIFPEGSLRLIASVEVLHGLMLIGLSVTFIYFIMQKLWDKK